MSVSLVTREKRMSGRPVRTKRAPRPVYTPGVEKDRDGNEVFVPLAKDMAVDSDWEDDDKYGDLDEINSSDDETGEVSDSDEPAPKRRRTSQPKPKEEEYEQDGFVVSDTEEIEVEGESSDEEEEYTDSEEEEEEEAPLVATVAGPPVAEVVASILAHDADDGDETDTGEPELN